MRFRAAVIAAALLIATPSTLFAKGCEGQSDVPMVKLLQSPPCETCEETKAEMAELLELERSRTPIQVKRAGDDVQRSVSRFLDGAGIAFDAVKLGACEGFFHKRRREEKAIVDAAKDAFCRLRPFNTPGNVLHPVKEARPDDSYSYPSGHATYGATVGLLLAEMLPEKRAEIYSRIDDYARSRMIAGVHFRSDVEAGKLIGAAIGTALLAREGSRVEFEEAKTCMRRATGLP